MLKLNLSPVRSDETQSEVFYTAPVLTVDGTSYDLSELPDGATATHPVLGNVSRIGLDYEVTLKLSHGSNAPETTRFPVPIEVTQDGLVELPMYDTPEPEITDELA
jgi:hypothetical protein